MTLSNKTTTNFLITKLKASHKMKLVVFIDYDNLQEPQKAAGILDVATKVLMRLPLNVQTGRGACEIRVYGGWYEGLNMTQLAQKLSVAIADDFPAIIRLPSAVGTIALATTAELAVSMIEEPQYHLFNTYRKKGRPGNLRVQRPEQVGCTDLACPLPIAKKLLKNGSCSLSSCTITADDLVYRHEQKIVDSMLTCDMVYASQLMYDHIVLVSGDDDFLPPIRTLLLRGKSVARFHPRSNQMRAPISNAGRRLVEIDL